MFPCIEQAREDIRTLRQLQLSTRTGESHSSSHSPDFIPLTQPEHGWRFHLSAKRNIDYV